MIILFIFSFLAGLVTILAPCIWPVLPIVLSSSIAGKGGHQRPLGITIGVMVSFTIFTLFLSTFVQMFHFNPNVLRIFAVFVIGILGVTMLIPAFSAKFEVFVSKLANIFGNRVVKSENGFIQGIITGLSLGVIWSPCAGPILATIATLAATGKVTIDVFLVTISYVFGVGIPLFLFAYGGQKVITKTKGIANYTGRIQQVFGIIMIVAAIMIYTNYDQTLQLQLLKTFPQLSPVLNGFETNPIVTKRLQELKGGYFNNGNANTTGNLFNDQTPAPDFVGITHWLNTQGNISLKNLRGKVILVDFWTYTCINCIRTLPHVMSWYEKYKDQGFIVIGIHTPEFAFEHDTKNVQNAIASFHIPYPVGQDNDYATWNAYNNEYWPAEYLIDVNGVIRRHAYGEGEYDQTELAIQTLLKEAGKKVKNTLDSMPDQTPHNQISPETYLGSQRMQYEYPNGTLGNGQQSFTEISSLPHNSFSYGGNWTITNENAITGNNATLTYNFTANKVYIILRPGGNVNGKVKVILDGKNISNDSAGKDVVNGIISITADRLYQVVDLHSKTENHVLRLEFQTPRIQAYTFTFG